MLYSVQFFAISAKDVTSQMVDSPATVLAKTEQFLKGQLDLSPEAFGAIAEAAEAICRGQIPMSATQPYFDAAYAILNCIAEHIRLGCFQDFRHYEFLEQTGIWPWTHREQSPFPLPVGEELLPQFGYLSAAMMRDAILPGVASLPVAVDQDVQFARNQFLEVAESVSADGLDLVVYCAVW